MSTLAERFRVRLAQLGLEADALDERAEAYANQADRMVSALVPKQLRRAVLERARLVDEWPPIGGAFSLPSNVAPDDVKHALERTGDKAAAVLGRKLSEEGWFFLVNAVPNALNAVRERVIDTLAEKFALPTDEEGEAAVFEAWRPLLEAHEKTAEAWNRLADFAERTRSDPNPPSVRGALLEGLQQAVEAFGRALAGSAVEDTAVAELEELTIGVTAATSSWPLGEVVLVVSVTKDVEADQRRPAVRVSAKPPSRSAIQALSEGGPRDGLTGWTEGGPDGQGCYALVLNGRRKQEQLALRLHDFGAGLSASLVRQLLDTFKEDGVRDWLVLHDMAQQQGGKGSFRWSWQEHRELGGYDRRRQNAKGRTELDMAREVVRRLVAFKWTELHLEQRRDDRVGWMRVGPFGLIDIPLGEDKLLADGTRLTTVAGIRINPGLYRGAAIGERSPYFALVDQTVLRMPRIPQMLAVYFALNARVARDAGGVLRFEARTLWDYAAVEGRAWRLRKRWPRAQETLERNLDEIAKSTGWTWEREDEGRSIADTIYRVTPPDWWTDRVMLGVPAIAALPSTAGVPRTGTELTAWRTALGLPLREVAVVVGVSPATVLRAERKADAALPDGWAGKLAQARKAMRGG